MDDDTPRYRRLMPVILPTATVLTFGFVIIARHPGIVEIVTTMIATGFTLIAGLFALRVARKDMLAPLRHLIERLDPGSAHPDEEDEIRLTQAIDRLVDDLVHMHRQKNDDVSNMNRQLHDAVSRLESINRDVETRERKARQDLREQASYHKRLLSAVQLPLGSITGFTNIMLAGEGKREDECLRELESAARRLNFLVKELQEVDHDASQQTTFPLAQVIDDVLDCFHPLAMDEGFAIYPLLADSCPDYLKCAEPVLRALLFHYLVYRTADGNNVDCLLECHYSESGDLIVVLSSAGESKTAPHSRLRMLTSASNANLEDGLLTLPVQVSDRIGKPTFHHRARILDDDPLRHRSLVSRLKRMGITTTSDARADLCFAGTLEDVDDAIPQGTPVFLTNSTTAIHDIDVIPLRQPLRHVELLDAIESVLSPPQSLTDFTVLAVDDNEANLRLLVSILEEAGVRVVSATDGIEALAAIDSNDIDLVFMDVQMPRLDGAGATRKIREESSELPVIGLSASFSSEESRRLRQAGMNDVLQKPLTRQGLEQLLLRWLQPKPSARPPVFDRQLSLQRANEKPALASELFEMLMASLREDRERINEAWRDNDQQRLAELVHRLHGGIRYCGVSGLDTAISELEEAVRQGCGEASDALESVNREIDRLLAWHEENPSPFEA